MAERKSGPVKPPVIDLKARDASQPAGAEKPAAKTAPGKAAPRPRPEQSAAPETVVETAAPPEPVADTPPEANEPRPLPQVEKSEPKPEPQAEAKPEPKPERRPEPEPVRASSPPAPPVRRARLAMPWSAISIAAIGGALLGTALTYTLVNLVPMPSGAPVIADPAEQLADLDGRLAALEQRLPAIEENGLETRVSLDAAATKLDSGLAGATADITALATRVAEVEAAATPVDLGPLTTQLDTLEGRVTAIAAGASSADAAALADSLNAIEASVAQLATRLDAADQRLAQIDAIRTELNTAKAAIAAQTQTLAGADIGPAVKLPLVVSGLETALAAGRPYTAELEGLRALLPDLAVPEALAAAAASGLERPDALATGFRAAVPTILAGRATESTGDWGQDAIEWAKGLLALRPAGEMEGNTPEAIVSRLEAAVERRDFIAAAALLEQLPEPMQVAAGDVATHIRAHATADGFIAGLRAQALATGTEATP